MEKDELFRLRRKFENLSKTELEAILINRESAEFSEEAYEVISSLLSEKKAPTVLNDSDRIDKMHFKDYISSENVELYINKLIHPRENILFVLSLIISIVVVILLLVSLVGIVYIVIGILIGILLHGIAMGRIKGNGIRVTERQFGDIYNITKGLSKEMRLKYAPETYILQSGGVLNAFATRFSGRCMVVIYSDVLEAAYEGGTNAVSFIIAHELAHHKRNHITKKLLVTPASIIPFISSAYSRSCEYTCDAIAAHYVKDDNIMGLTLLAAGKRLHSRVNISEIVTQSDKTTGFWVWFSELISTHPHLIKRIKRIQKL